MQQARRASSTRRARPRGAPQARRLLTTCSRRLWATGSKRSTAACGWHAYGPRWAAIRNNGLASAVLVRVVQPRCLPRTSCCSLAAVAIDTCRRCLGRWPKPWGWAASPEAPNRNASHDSHAGIAWCSPGLVGGRPPPGGPSGRPPAPRTPSDMAFGARTPQVAHRLHSRIDHWRPVGGLPLSL